ncbi:hypothetical protein GCM10011415_37600 [Salipiger pallidus]|uniref:YscD/Y4YQ C-terminal domain-containing protein n=1 Tax=Salipiger pallidus TaxID=1775170 RepID=A0A8J2ZMK8_9RHOB|nr:hypothetical protein [Salipiger pallidus]GGG84049.1 hypothetical protein GCM10011415_37600 [Salipiger pallidus]
MIDGLVSQMRWSAARLERRIRGALALDREAEIEMGSTGGLLQGSRRQFSGNLVDIGSGPQDDVRLPDEDVVEGHVRIHLRPTAFGIFMTVEARGAGVVVDGDEVAQGSESHEIRLPATLELGSASMRLAPPESASARRSTQSMTFGVGCVVASLLLGVVFGALVPPSGVEMRATAPYRPTEPALPPEGAPERQAMQTVRERLTEVGLSPFIEADLAPGGTLVVNGVIPARAEPDWRSFNRWYDRQPGLPVMVRNVTVAGGLSDLPAIALIHLEEPRQVQFADGTRVGKGDLVVDGWQVEAIADTEMTLTRRGERIAVSY